MFSNNTLISLQRVTIFKFLTLHPLPPLPPLPSLPYPPASSCLSNTQYTRIREYVVDSSASCTRTLRRHHATGVERTPRGHQTRSRGGIAYPSPPSESGLRLPCHRPLATPHPPTPAQPIQPTFCRTNHIILDITTGRARQGYHTVHNRRSTHPCFFSLSLKSRVLLSAHPHLEKSIRSFT